MNAPKLQTTNQCETKTGQQIVLKVVKINKQPVQQLLKIKNMFSRMIEKNRLMQKSDLNYENWQKLEYRKSPYGQIDYKTQNIKFLF